VRRAHKLQAIKPQMPTSENVNSRIERELVRIVFGNWPQYVDGIPFALLVAVLMCGLVPSLGQAPMVWVAAWLALQLAWSVGAVIFWQYHRNHERRATSARWEQRLRLVWALRGVLWGAVILVFWDPARPAGETLLCSVLLAVMVGSFFTLSPCRMVFLVNLACLISAALAGLVVSEGTFARALSLFLPPFGVLIMSYGWQLSSKYRRAVALCFENESMARALAHAKQAAEESSLAKSRFLANMSHELRTPLNAIIGFSEVIRDHKLGEFDAAKYSEYAGDVVVSARHLLGLINRILDLAKIEAGKMAFETSLFPIGEMLTECARSIQAAATGKGLVLILDDRCDGRLAHGDATAVRQILLDLLSNAVNFTARGEVRLSARIEGPMLEIEVADTGCGISEEVLPRIFFPFERGDNSLQALHGGTGLGLTLVRCLAEAHGGTCRVESAVGQRTTFCVGLPIVSAREISEAA